MPGFSFTGKIPSMEAFTPKQAPILDVPPNAAQRQEHHGPLPGAAGNSQDGHPRLAVGHHSLRQKPGRCGFGRQVAPSSRRRVRRPAQAGAEPARAKEKLSPALAEAVYRGVARIECSHSALQTQGGSGGILPTETTVTVRIANLVKTSTAEVLQSTAMVAAAVDEARCRLQLLQQTLDTQPLKKDALNFTNIPLIDKNSYQKLQCQAAFQDAQGKIGPQAAGVRPSASLVGGGEATLLLKNGLVLLPAKAGVEIEVRAESGPGMLTRNRRSASW